MSLEAVMFKLLHERPVNSDLQSIDDILRRMFQKPDKEMHQELAEFLDYWQFRLEIFSIVHDANEEELSEADEVN